jgi:peptide/nickel transport system substrate-binding protein
VIETDGDLMPTAILRNPSGAWFDPFAGGNTRHISPARVFADDPANADEDFLSNLIGNGPCAVELVSPNDHVPYAFNESFRELNKPFFSGVLLKGGGDAASAARAVPETDEYDDAMSLQVLPNIVDGSQYGQVVIMLVVSVERLHSNCSDPNTEVDGQRSGLNTPRSFQTIPAVREAMNLALNRERIASEL